MVYPGGLGAPLFQASYSESKTASHNGIVVQFKFKRTNNFLKRLRFYNPRAAIFEGV